VFGIYGKVAGRVLRGDVGASRYYFKTVFVTGAKQVEELGFVSLGPPQAYGTRKKKSGVAATVEVRKM
tara:strand:+ start:1052 stop:1255 length:204 start_codon:yes stop_codon:yes gene_type:complete